MSNLESTKTRVSLILSDRNQLSFTERKFHARIVSSCLSWIVHTHKRPIFSVCALAEWVRTIFTTNARAMFLYKDLPYNTVSAVSGNIIKHWVSQR